MRKVVEIIGFGHREGTSKAGKPYSLYIVHMIYDDQNTEGKACSALVVPDEIASQVRVGESAVVYTQYINGREYLTGYYPNA